MKRLMLAVFALAVAGAFGGIREMKEAFEKNLPKTIQSVRLTFVGVASGYDVYNCSIPFVWGGVRYIFGRVEPHDKWASSRVFLFREISPDTWSRVLEFGSLDLEDPYVAFIKGELVVGGTRVTKVSGGVTGYHGDFYRDHGKGPLNLEYFTMGPAGMKDIRLVELKDGRIGVFSRPRGEEVRRKYGSDGVIGFASIASLDELTPEVIEKAPAIDGIFGKGEWGGCNQAYLQKDGTVLVAAHLSYIAGKAKGYTALRPVYCNAVFTLDPATRKATHIRLVATRRMYPACEPKLPYLDDCVFTSGFVFNEDGTVDVYTGLCDAHEGRIRLAAADVIPGETGVCRAEAETKEAFERPFTVVPFGIGMDATTEQAAETICRIHGLTGIDRFALHAPGHGVRTSGYYDEKGYRGVGRRVKAIQDAVADKGIKVGFLMGPTINVGINHPWTKVVRRNGQVRAFSACPGDPAFRKAFAAHCAAVAEECHPFLYMMEDDFCYAWDTVCLCDWHKAHPDRVMEDLYLLAAEAAKAIHRVSPETRIGLSAPGGYREQAARIARTLADGGKPFIRWYGTDYGFDVPMRLPEFLWMPLWTKQNISDGMQCVYEADAAPNSPFYGSGARLIASASVMLANGFEGLWYWAGGVRTAKDEPMPNAETYGRSSRDLAAVEACGREGSPVGVSALTAAGGRLMARYGIPYRTIPGGVEVYTGDFFSTCSDAEVKRILSGRVLLDGDAACELTRRGFADLIGAKAVARKGAIDFVGEIVRADGSRIGSSFHQNYGLDGSEVRRLELAGADEVSYYFSGASTNRVQSAVTRYANALGGRIVVLATCLQNATPTNLLNYRKRRLILDALAWLGGETAVPVRTGKEVNVLLFANEDAAKSRLFVHATYLSGDSRDTLELVVAPPYRGGRVEVLEQGAWVPIAAVWKDGHIVIPRTLHLYDTLAVKISRAK